jgi:uncharacterized membrane protein
VVCQVLQKNKKSGMINFRIKREIWLWLILAAPLILFMALHSRLPDKIPSHFDMRGHANAYMSPGSFILVMTAISVFLYLLTLVLPMIDPKKANYILFAKTYEIIRIMVLLVFTAITCLSLLIAIGISVNITRIIFLIILLLFMVMGNFLSNVRPNWFIGIRTPWTLSSESVWKKTHQFGGKLMFFAGLAGFICCIFLPDILMIWIFSILVGGASLIPVVYSYIIYRKEEKQPDKTNPV